jgi:hypothetical protein
VIRYRESGGEKTLSVTGHRSLIKGLCRPILSCGLVLILATVSVVAVICLLMPSVSGREKAIGALVGGVVTISVWISVQTKRLGPRFKRWLQKRGSEAPINDADSGSSTSSGGRGPVP